MENILVLLGVACLLWQHGLTLILSVYIYNLVQFQKSLESFNSVVK